MGVRSDAVLALVLVLGLHAASLALIADRPAGGATAAGDGGTELVTIAPVSGDVAALIAAWEAPPVVAPDLPEPVAEPAPDLSVPVPERAPEPPNSDTAVPPSPEALAPPPSMQAPTAPDAAPPPKPEPTVRVNPDLHPKARPAPKSDPTPTPKPQPKREPKPAPVPAAQAAGEGDGGAVGQEGQAQAGTADSAGMQDALVAWGADIRARIERKKTYPRAADGATGVVTLVITVSTDGALLSVSVAASSGNPVLDAAAVQAVQAARLSKGPAGMNAAGHSFRFRLRYER